MSSLSLEQLSAELHALRTQNSNLETRVIVLENQNSLLFPIVSKLYKSHLVKASSRLIYWSLWPRYNSYVSPEKVTLLDTLVSVLMSSKWGYECQEAENKAMELSEQGCHCDKDREILGAASLYQGAYTPGHLHGRSPKNTIGNPSRYTINRLSAEVSPDLDYYFVEY
jgi:hypothetical protein